MSEKRLRISIIVLLVAVAITSFGCGGGSGAGPATGGDFTTSVMPDTGSTPGGGGNAPGNSAQSTRTAQQEVDNGDQGGDGDNGSGGPTVSTQGGGGNTPGSSTRNAQAAQNSLPYGHQIVDLQEEDYPLPWEHGLVAGRIVVLPGESEEYGNMVVTCASGTAACIVNVGTEGLVTYNSHFSTPSFTLIPPGGFPAIPLPLATEAAQAPVVEVDFGTTLHVGSNVDPRDHSLTTGVDRNGVSVSYGQVRDGIGANEVLEFMNQHVSLVNKIVHTGVGDAPGLETFTDPPTIRLAEGTSDSYARFTAHAVQLINNALPYEKRITISPETLPIDTELGDLSEGEIFLNFGSLASSALGGAKLLSSYNENQEEVQKALKALVTINEHQMRKAFVYDPPPDPVENTPENWKTILEEYWGSKFPDSRVENSDTIIKFYNDRIFLSVVVHELMHALGFYHIDETRYSDSIMHSLVNGGQVNVPSPYLPVNSLVIIIPLQVVSSTDEETTAPVLEATTAQLALEATTDQPERNSPGRLATADARSMPGHILFPIDRAALLAAYGRLDPGAQPDELTAENLGSWTDTSFHLRGDVDFQGGRASFGVASGNGLIQPWASGPTPWTNLADNETLSGSATWNGALLGITSSSETVAGDARLSVNLASLRGQLDFTGMEKWGVNEAPGAAGSGTTWDDGDLGYTIEVRGNTFIQTGGDDGKVTGAFFGVVHEAMGGVLERADLAAGFGGKR